MNAAFPARIHPHGRTVPQHYQASHRALFTSEEEPESVQNLAEQRDINQQQDTFTSRMISQPHTSHNQTTHLQHWRHLSQSLMGSEQSRLERLINESKKAIQQVKMNPPPFAIRDPQKVAAYLRQSQIEYDLYDAIHSPLQNNFQTCRSEWALSEQDSK